MGTGIHGWLERGRDLDDDGEPDYWTATISARMLFDRSYEFFGSFFGVRNYANFDPVAADRGLPDVRSETVENAFPEGDVADSSYHSATWLTLDEDIDWLDRPRIEHPGEFDRNAWSRATTTCKFTADGDLLDRNVSLLYDDGNGPLSDAEFETLKRRRAVESGAYRYESYPKTRFEAASGQWVRLSMLRNQFDRLRRAERAELRLVVWFDS